MKTNHPLRRGDLVVLSPDPITRILEIRSTHGMRAVVASLEQHSAAPGRLTDISLLRRASYQQVENALRQALAGPVRPSFVSADPEGVFDD